MCKLSKVFFGYADAEEEFNQRPELFDSAFVDPHNYLDKILNDSKYLILGRKGSGKTAFSAKIRRVADLSDNITANPCSLADMDYVSFNRFAEANVAGGRRFHSIWKFLLMTEILKMIFNEFPERENSKLTELYEGLKSHGFITGDSLVRVATKIRRTQIVLNVAEIFKTTADIEHDVTLNGLDEIADLILETIRDSYFGERKFFLIIDGLDDVLRLEDFSPDIVTGLIRAISYINKSFSKAEVRVKVVLLMRTDIYELCQDPDLNKIKRDAAINLSWTKDDLKNIVYKRISVQYPHLTSFSDFWGNYAPAIYKNARSESFLFELTLLRPRDILQFFIECQDMYGNNNLLSYSELNTVANGYSKNYFIGEMRDELTGLLDDTIVTAIPGILSSMGTRKFREADIEARPELKDLDCTAHQLLETMYNAGYIGQLRNRDGKRLLSFRHFNLYDRYNAKDECIVHRGIAKAVNIG